MSKRAFIVHGWDGYPEEGWFPWLKSELEKNGIEVSVLAMPNPEKPIIKVWVPYLKKQIGIPDKDTFLIGHSMGCQTILRYLESLPKNLVVGGLVLVAGFVNLNNLSKEELMVAKPWLTSKINLEKVRSHLDNIIAIFSSNDSWVPLSDSLLFKKELGAKVILLKNKGHFSGEDGVRKLPVVLEEILKFSKD